MYPGKNLMYYVLPAPSLRTKGRFALIAVKRVRQEML